MSLRDRRDGPYFVCAECRWCWTVSITGTIYVQSDWPPLVSPREAAAGRRVNRLLNSIDGLEGKLASTSSPL